MAVSLCGYALFVHLRNGKAFVNKRILNNKYDILIHLAQMKIHDRMTCFQTRLYGIIQINPKHSGHVNGVHVNGINFIRNVNIHFNILIDGQKQFGIQDTFQFQYMDM